MMAAIAGATAAARRGRRHGDARAHGSSPEIFGDAGESPQDESSPMRPRSPYGVAKLAAHELVGVLRERLGLYAVRGITFNHESPRRPDHFLPRKVTRGAAAIALGQQEELVLGDLDAVRDWTHAADVVRGAWLSLQAEEPGDYVFASGVGRTVRDLVDAAFARGGRVVRGPCPRGPGLRPPAGGHAAGRRPARARTTLGWAAGDRLRGPDRGDGLRGPGRASGRRLGLQQLRGPRGSSAG